MRKCVLSAARYGHRTVRRAANERDGAPTSCPIPISSKRKRASMSDTAANIDRLWSLISDIPVAMVVTHEGQGLNMWARPMAVRPVETRAQSIF